MGRILTWTAVAAIAALAPALTLASEQQDRDVAEQIATILRDHGQMQNYSIGVKYKSGTVWLSGRVTNKQQMQSALQTVSDIEGVEQIVNNLSVGGGGASQASGLQQPSGMNQGPPRGAAKARLSSALMGGNSGVRQVSATGPDMVSRADGELAMRQQAMQQQAGQQGGPDDGEVPAGFHRLQTRHAAKARPIPAYAPGGGGVQPAAFDQPHLPNYAWPSYAAYPNYASLTYPKQYSPTAFPFIGPFYPYPQVPLGWRKVSLEWDDGWWFLDFQDRSHH